MSPIPRNSVQHLSHSMETTFDDTISDFFKCMSIPDQADKLGRTYVYFYNSLTRLINMSPEEITQIYINYIKSLNEDKSIDISKRVWIYNDKSPSDEEYVMKYQKVFRDILDTVYNPSEMRSRTFVFTLELWLYTYH